MISATDNFTFKIGNGKDIGNIFTERLSHDL